MTAGRLLPLIVAAIALGLVAAIVVTRAEADRTETGVVVAVESVSLTDVRGFTIRTSDGRTVEFRIGTLENGAQFPPGHLVEHQATSAPVKVFYRDVGTAHVAYRIEDAPISSSRDWPGAQPRSASARSSSASLKTASNDARIVPSAPTTKTYGSDNNPKAIVAGTAWS